MDGIIPMTPPGSMPVRINVQIDAPSAASTNTRVDNGAGASTEIGPADTEADIVSDSDIDRRLREAAHNASRLERVSRRHLQQLLDSQNMAEPYVRVPQTPQTPQTPHSQSPTQSLTKALPWYLAPAPSTPLYLPSSANGYCMYTC